jgi:tellurite resistance protein
MPFHIQEAFKNIPWAGDDPQSQPLLVAELAFWSAMSDGVIEEQELTTIVATVRQLPHLANYTLADAQKTLKRIEDELDDEDRMIARIEDITKKISEPHLRRVAYQLAVFCASADGMFTDAESAFLEGLREEFHIPSVEAKRLIDEVIGK